MKLLSWNIRHGGGKRTSRILDSIQQSHCDAVVLTEFRIGASGDKIQEGLSSMGLKHIAVPEVGPKTNSVLFATRNPFEIATFENLDSIDRHRAIVVRWDVMNLAALYFAQGKKKISLFEFLLQLPASFLAEKSLLIGDFNTGKHKLDEVHSTFQVPEYLDALERAGWVDAWRAFHGDRREYTWFSNSGNGFRIDHAFASSQFNRELAYVYYDHSVRERGLSDHSRMELAW